MLYNDNDGHGTLELFHRLLLTWTDVLLVKSRIIIIMLICQDLYRGYESWRTVISLIS